LAPVLKNVLLQLISTRRQRKYSKYRFFTYISSCGYDLHIIHMTTTLSTVLTRTGYIYFFNVSVNHKPIFFEF